MCSAHRGMLSTSGGIQHIGGYHKYIEGCLVHRRDIMMHVGDTKSTSGDVGDTMSTAGDMSISGNVQYIGRIS